MKKTLLEVAHEIATGLYEAGVIDAAKMREYESLCALEYKFSHIPNEETRKAISPLDVEGVDMDISSANL
jgi:hypothetical protein